MQPLPSAKQESHLLAEESGNNEATENSIGGMFVGIVDLAITSITLASFAGGVYFIAQALIDVANPPYQGTDPATLGMSRLLVGSLSNPNAMLGVALLLLALVLTVYRGFRQMYILQARQVKIAERQNVYLKFLAQQARK